MKARETPPKCCICRIPATWALTWEEHGTIIKLDGTIDRRLMTKYEFYCDVHDSLSPMLHDVQ